MGRKPLPAGLSPNPGPSHWVTQFPVYLPEVFCAHTRRPAHAWFSYFREDFTYILYCTHSSALSFSLHSPTRKSYKALSRPLNCTDGETGAQSVTLQVWVFRWSGRRAWPWHSGIHVLPRAHQTPSASSQLLSCPNCKGCQGGSHKGTVMISISTRGSERCSHCPEATQQNQGGNSPSCSGPPRSRLMFPQVGTAPQHRLTISLMPDGEAPNFSR